MSVWSTAEVTVAMGINSGVSMKKVFEEVFEDEFQTSVISERQLKNKRITHYRIRFCRDGLWAARTIDSLVVRIPKEAVVAVSGDINW